MVLQMVRKVYAVLFCSSRGEFLLNSLIFIIEIFCCDINTIVFVCLSVVTKDHKRLRLEVDVVKAELKELKTVNKTQAEVSFSQML